MALADFESFRSVEEAEKRLRQATAAEHAHALNNHAENLERLNQHHEEMHKAVARLNDQMDAVLDSLTQINRRLDGLERPAKTMQDAPEGVGHA